MAGIRMQEERRPTGASSKCSPIVTNPTGGGTEEGQAASGAEGGRARGGGNGGGDGSGGSGGGNDSDIIATAAASAGAKG